MCDNWCCTYCACLNHRARRHLLGVVNKRTPGRETPTKNGYLLSQFSPPACMTTDVAISPMALSGETMGLSGISSQRRRKRDIELESEPFIRQELGEQEMSLSLLSVRLLVSPKH